MKIKLPEPTAPMGQFKKALAGVPSRLEGPLLELARSQGDSVIAIYRRDNCVCVDIAIDETPSQQPAAQQAPPPLAHDHSIVPDPSDLPQILRQSETPEEISRPKGRKRGRKAGGNG